MIRSTKFSYKLIQTLIFSIILTLFSTINIFAIDDGIYLVPTTTYYVNPDTGEIDDIGSGNTALGEAMTRSALGEKALLEIKDGKNYVTFRLNLISNISDVNIYTQNSKGGTYSKASTTIKAENYASDYADYRFEVKNLDYYVCLEFYVAPMGRNVKFYASFDQNKATAGNGDFVTTIKIEEPTTSKTEETTASNSTSSSATTTSTTSSSNSSDNSSSNTASTTSESSQEETEQASKQTNSSTTTQQTTSTNSTQATETKESATQSNSTTTSTQSSTTANTNQQVSSATNNSASTTSKDAGEELSEESDVQEESSTSYEEAISEDDDSKDDNSKVAIPTSAEGSYNKKITMKSSNSNFIAMIIFIVVLGSLISIIIKFGKR